MDFLAIYHLSAKIVSRAQGQSVVASAAYRAADHLQDQRIGKTFDYSHKRGVEHAEILAPEGAPAWVFDRQQLWNAVEAVERRKDAQLARELEIALPVALTRQEQIALVRDYAQRTFVSQGMVVDVAVHRDNEENPHAHLLMTTRGLSGDGFGRKQRAWNERSQLLSWWEKWAETANEHLLLAGHEIRIDHRSLEAQGLDLAPGRKIGISAKRQRSLSLPAGLREKVAEQREIAEENGRRILEDPSLALKAMTYRQATFTERDLAKWLHGKTDGAEQFQAAFLKITASSELVAIGSDDRGRKRFTTKEMRGAIATRAVRAARCSSGACRCCWIPGAGSR